MIGGIGESCRRRPIMDVYSGQFNIQLPLLHFKGDLRDLKKQFRARNKSVKASGPRASSVNSSVNFPEGRARRQTEVP